MFRFVVRWGGRVFNSFLQNSTHDATHIKKVVIRTCSNYNLFAVFWRRVVNPRENALNHPRKMQEHELERIENEPKQSDNEPKC